MLIVTRTVRRLNVMVTLTISGPTARLLWLAGAAIQSPLALQLAARAKVAPAGQRGVLGAAPASYTKMARYTAIIVYWGGTLEVCLHDKWA